MRSLMRMDGLLLHCCMATGLVTDTLHREMKLLMKSPVSFCFRSDTHTYHCVEVLTSIPPLFTLSPEFSNLKSLKQLHLHK